MGAGILDRSPRQLSIVTTPVVVAIAALSALALIGPAGASAGGRDAPLHANPVLIEIGKTSRAGKLRQAARDARSDWIKKADRHAALGIEKARGAGGGQIRIEARSGQARKLRVKRPSHARSVAGKPAKVLVSRRKARGMSAKRLQGHVCNGIGKALGLEEAGPRRDDCMEDPGRHARVKKGRTFDQLDDLYGPSFSFKGSLERNRERIRTDGDYELEVVVSGHALAEVELFGDGRRITGADAPDCDTDCEVSLGFRTEDLPIGELEPGRYLIEARATDTFGETATGELDVWAGFPYFGYNDDWSIDAWLDLPEGEGPYAAANAGGANSARMNVNWAGVERCGRKGFDWSRPDAAFRRLFEAGMRPLVVLTGAPDCRAQSCPVVEGAVSPPPSQASNVRWREFVRTAANRYRSALALEIWNEPNATTFWGGCEPDPERLAELTRIAAEAVADSKNPEMTVLMGGLTPSDPDAGGSGGWLAYLRDVIAAGLPADVEIALHPYLGAADCDAGRSHTDSALDQLEAARAAAPGREIWVTEFGVPGIKLREGDCRGRNRINQGADLAEAYTAFQQADVPAVLVHQLIDSPLSNGRYAGSYGVMEALDDSRARFEPKPAYCELATARGVAPGAC